MFKTLTTMTALGTALLICAVPLSASAQNMEIVIETEKAAAVDDDALNYFAAGAQAEVEAEAQAPHTETGDVIDGPAVPARELQYLPEAVAIGGDTSAKLRMVNGRLVTEKTGVTQATTVSAGQPEETNTAAPASETPAPLAPTTLNAQLKAKEGVTATPAAATTPETVAAQPEQTAAPAAAPAQSEPDAAPAAAIEPAVGVGIGAGVGTSAIIDKAQGAKINIISNTDTGVSLGQ